MKRKIVLRPVGLLRFFLLFGVVFWLWWVFRSYLLFMGILIMAGSVLVSAVCMFFVAGNLQAEVAFPGGQAQKGNPIPVLIRLKKLAGPGRFLGAVIESRCSVRNAFTESSRDEKERLFATFSKDTVLRYELESQFSGLVELRFSPVRVYDWFGIFRCDAGRDVRKTTVIFPAVGVREEGSVQACVENFPREEELMRRGTDSQPTGEVREYVPGDELKNIHWKLTAKQLKTMVRERTAQGREKINVLLLFSGDEEENDGRMDALRAVCALLIKKEYPVQLYWPGADGRFLNGSFLAEESDLDRALAQILSVSAGARRGAKEEDFCLEHPGEHYVLIRRGSFKGEYI